MQSTTLLTKRAKKTFSFSCKLLILFSVLATQSFLAEIFFIQNQLDKSLIKTAQADASDSWFNSAYSYRKAITVDHTKVPNTDQANFPMLVSLTDNSLKTTANGGKVQNENGYDIIFSNQEGSAKLDHEIESYDGTTGTIVMWVRIPLLSHSIDTVIYMYYGNGAINTSQENKTGVWDSNFKLVQHLSESPANGVKGHIDSTYYGNDGTPYNFNNLSYSTTNSSGMIDGANAFDNLDDYVSVDNSESLNINDSITVDLWLSYISLPSGNIKLLKRGEQGLGGFYLELSSAGNLIFTNDAASSQSITGSVTLNASTWYHITLVQNGIFRAIYINGALDVSDNSAMTPISYAGPTLIGSSVASVRKTIDEVSISNVARSADWIKTEYNNQYSPKGFYKMGREEVSDPASLYLWQYRKMVTIDHSRVSCSSSLADFPVLVSISSDTDLALSSQADGEDILFTSSSISWMSGTTNNKLSHEIESYDSATGNLLAWVKIPSLSCDADTVLYMYYGNTTAENHQDKMPVWDKNFLMVEHLNQDPSGISPQMKNSTQYLNDGSSYGSMTFNQSVPGPIGRALNLDGVDDYVSIGDNPSLNITGYEITMEAWINFSPGSTQYSTILGKTNSNTAGWDFRVVSATPNSTTTTVALRVNGNYYNGTSGANPMTLTLDNGVWYHLVSVYNGSQILIYKNGALTNSYNFTSQIFPVSEAFTLGRLSNGGFYAAGSLDEVRISNIARSSDWILTEYNNQSSPSTFLTLSSQESYMNHFTLTGSSSQNLGESQTIIITAKGLSGEVDSQYSGDKTVTLSGANPDAGRLPTYTDKNGNQIPFGSNATLTFTDGIATTVITLYKIETAAISVSDGTYQSSPFSIQVRSQGSVFLPPSKPLISSEAVNTGDLSSLPANITQIAISRTPDFKDASWQDFDSQKYSRLSECTDTLYIKFRTQSGATSDTFVYTPQSNQILQEGDIVRTSHHYDVFIIKYQNGKKYKRLILSPSVFNSYQHLLWTNIKTVSQEELDKYQTSNLVRVKGDNNIYSLFPEGDTGKRRIYEDITKILKQVQDDTAGSGDDTAWDGKSLQDVLDSIYEINKTDRDSYVLVQ